MSYGHGRPGDSPALPLSTQLAHQQHHGSQFKHELSPWGAEQQETKCRSPAGQRDPQPQEPLTQGL